MVRPERLASPAKLGPTPPVPVIGSILAVPILVTAVCQPAKEQTGLVVVCGSLGVMGSGPASVIADRTHATTASSLVTLVGTFLVT